MYISLKPIGHRLQMKLDQTDKKIIQLLGADARMSNNQMAKVIGVTEGTVRNRIQKLIKKFEFGFIQFNKIFIQLENQGIGHHYISGISWAYLGHISGISLAYLGHILGISWAYLGHILGISRAYPVILDIFLTLGSGTSSA